MLPLNHSKVTEMSRCAILGASGHGKVIAEMAELNQIGCVDFF
ncbi:hypothetical protein QW180_08660 [Vibrio sinaloensis]|nr:hypothetical protein [Vibrio sinaloensis]